MLLRPAVAERILGLIPRNRDISFSEIERATRARNLLSHHRFVRRYMDVLVASGAVKVSLRRMRPPLHDQQLYRRVGPPRILVGVGVLELVHGLRFTGYEREIRRIETDMLGISLGIRKDGKIYGSVEDCLVYSFRESTLQGEPYMDFVTMIYTTTKTDNDYMLMRARFSKIEKLLNNYFTQVDSALRTNEPPGGIRLSAFIKARDTYLRCHGRQMFQARAGRVLIAPAEVVEAVAKQLVLT